MLRDKVDLEDPELDVRRMFHILVELFVQEQLLENEVAKARDTVRAQVLRMLDEDDSSISGLEYDSIELYGSHNDTAYSSLPPLTEQTETGYVGLDAPLN